MTIPEPPAAKRLLVIAGPADWVPASAPDGDPWPLIVHRADTLEQASRFAPDRDWDVVSFRIDAIGSRSPSAALEQMRELAPDATLLPIASVPDPREAIVYLKHGAFEVLEEPLAPEAFRRALAEAIENRETFREILDLNRTLEVQKEQLLHEKQELERKNRELEAVSLLARSLSSSLDLDEILDQLTHRIHDSLGFDRIVIGMVDAATAVEEARRTFAAGGVFAPDTVERLRWPVGEAGSTAPWVDTVLRQGNVLVVEDPASHPATRGTPLAEIHGNGFAKIPMVAQGSVLGTITVESREAASVPSEEEVSILGIFADTAAMAIENAILYRTMRELSVTDELTGLFNRRYFLRQLEAEVNDAERHVMPLSLLVVDIDHFKRLNDGNDHLVGDAALRKLSELLQRNIRGIDTAARYGGEEFVILLPRTGREGARFVAEKIRRLVERTPFEGEQAVPGGKLTVSVGAALYPDDAACPRELLECSDRALYRAKEGGRNRVHFWQLVSPAAEA